MMVNKTTDTTIQQTLIIKAISKLLKLICEEIIVGQRIISAIYPLPSFPNNGRKANNPNITLDGIGNFTNQAMRDNTAKLIG